MNNNKELLNELSQAQTHSRNHLDKSMIYISTILLASELLSFPSLHLIKWEALCALLMALFFVVTIALISCSYLCSERMFIKVQETLLYDDSKEYNVEKADRFMSSLNILNLYFFIVGLIFTFITLFLIIMRGI